MRNSSRLAPFGILGATRIVAGTDSRPGFPSGGPRLPGFLVGTSALARCRARAEASTRPGLMWAAMFGRLAKPWPGNRNPNDSIVDRGDLHFAQNRLRYGRVRICGGLATRFRGENDARRRAFRRRNLGLFGIVMSRLDHRNEKEHHVVNRMQIRGHVRRFA